MRVAFALLLLAACGPRGYRHELVGTGQAGAAGVAIQVPGQHRVDWTIAVPRSMKLAWTIDCGGEQVSGVAGETFEQYRARRIAQLQAEREREKQAVAALGGAVLGTVGASGRVETPNGEAEVAAQADGQAVSYAVADATMSSEIRLPAGDLGAATYDGTLTVNAAPGACTMSVAAEDGGDTAGVNGTFRVIHVIDVAVEASAKRAAERARVQQGSIEVRAAVEARLVSLGASAEVRARRIAAEAEARARAEAQARAEAEVRMRARAEAEARARAEAEARAEVQARIDAERRAREQAELEVRLRIEAEARAKQQAELDARLRVEAEARAKQQAELEARLRVEAEARARLWASVLEVRQRALAYLVGVCGADPEALARRRAAEEAARVRVAAEAQERRNAEMRARAELIAEMERRDALVLEIRARLVAQLIGFGAKEKTPMPDPILEDPGVAPADGAVWVAGEWVWRGGEWVWIAGGWTFPDDGFSSDTVVDNDVSIGVGVGVTVGDDDRERVRDHRDDDDATPVEPARPQTRDHRDDPPPPTAEPEERPRVRDHRDDDKPDSRPRVRDHRN